jgi:hypothetical protein
MEYRIKDLVSDLDVMDVQIATDLYAHKKSPSFTRGAFLIFQIQG